MTQNREFPKAERRAGEDFEWVNHWAASGAASRRYVRAEDQLQRDMAEIAAARDALIAQAIAERSTEQEQATPFRIPTTIAGARPRKNRDSVPILVGGLLATILLVAFGAVASIMQLGR